MNAQYSEIPPPETVIIMSALVDAPVSSVDLILATSDLANNTITTTNVKHQFELRTDEQVLHIEGLSEPLNSLNTMLHNTEPKVIHTDDHVKSDYIDLFPIRNLYMISSTLGTNLHEHRWRMGYLNNPSRRFI